MHVTGLYCRHAHLTPPLPPLSLLLFRSYAPPPHAPLSHPPISTLLHPPSPYPTPSPLPLPFPILPTPSLHHHYYPPLSSTPNSTPRPHPPSCHAGRVTARSHTALPDGRHFPPSVRPIALCSSQDVTEEKTLDSARAILERPPREILETLPLSSLNAVLEAHLISPVKGTSPTFSFVLCPRLGK